MSDTNNTGVKLPFCIQRPSQNTPATRVADIDDDNGVNLGTILSGKLNYTDASNTFLAINDAHRTYEQKLTGAKLSAVTSGISSQKVEQYDGYASGKQNVLSSAQMDAVNSNITANDVALLKEIGLPVRGSINGTITLGIRTDKRFLYTEQDGISLTSMTGNIPNGGHTALASQSFILAAPVIPTVSSSGRLSGWKYYIAVLKNGTWGVYNFSHIGSGSVSGDNFPTDPEEEGSPIGGTEPEPLIEATNDYVENYIGREAAVLIINENQAIVTASDASTQGTVSISYVAENFQDTVPMREQKGGNIHYGNHYFDGKVFLGNPNEPQIARRIDRYFETRNAELTYKAKLVNDEYICAPASMADNTYSLYVGVISVNPQAAPILCINSHNENSFFAKKASTFDIDGKIEILGKTIDGYGESNELLIVAPSNYLWYDISELTSNAALLDAKQSIRTLLDNYNAYAPCPWVEYNSITGAKAFPNFIGANSQSTAWHIDIDTLVGNIEIDATKGNRIFDFRNLKDANDEPIPVDFAVNIAGGTPYETIIFFKGIDIYSISPTSPLAMSDLCFCGEEPDLDTDKEYVLSIQGNTLIFGELSRGVDAETEEE